MLWVVVALAAAPAADEPSAPVRQAQAVVRIVRAATVRLGEGVLHGDDEPIVRERREPDADGVEQPLLLIEFS